MLFEKRPPPLVATEPHPFNLTRFEGVHGDAAHKGYVDTKTTVYAGAGEADEDTEFGGCPLRRWRAAVAADVVFGFFLKGGELYILPLACTVSL